MYHSSVSVFVANKTPSGVKKHHMKVPNQKVAYIGFLLSFSHGLVLWIHNDGNKINKAFYTELCTPFTFSQVETHSRTIDAIFKLYMHAQTVMWKVNYGNS